MGIVINRIPALIGVDVSHGGFNIYSRQARLEIRQRQAQIQIETTKPKVEIDQYEAFASAGLKNMADLTAEISAMSQQAALNYIAKKSQEGDYLATLPVQGNPIAQIALNNYFQDYETAYDYIPKVPPRFNVIEGTVRVDPGPLSGNVNTAFIPNQIDLQYTPTQVRIYIQQYGKLDIDFRPEKIDVKL